MVEWRLGQISSRTGVSAKRIRQYERLGLLDGVARTSGNQRTFSDAHLDRLELIKRMRAADMPLADIKLALRVLEGRAFGVEVEGIDRVLALCASIRTRVSVTEEIVNALRRRAVTTASRRSGPAD